MPWATSLRKNFFYVGRCDLPGVASPTIRGDGTPTSALAERDQGFCTVGSANRKQSQMNVGLDVGVKISYQTIV